MSIFYVVQTSRNVLNLNCFRLVRSKFDQITFKGKLLRIGIDYSDHHFEICWILQFSFDKSRHSEWRFDVIENSGWLGMTLEVKLIKNLADFRVNEANRSFFLANFQGQILQIVVVWNSRFELNCRISIKTKAINNYLVRILDITSVRNLQFLSESFTNLTLNIHRFKGDRVVSYYWNSVPNILWTFLFEKSYAACVLAT